MLAPHHIVLGTIPEAGNIVLAFLENLSTGECIPALVTRRNSSSAITAIPNNAILCLGDHDDMLEIVDVPDQHTVCGITDDFLPLNYLGRTLTTYLGDGNDHFHGGNGTDVVHGDSGADDIYTAAGTSEVIKGWNSADTLYCSAGSSTTCDGGTGADDIEESSAASSDVLIGGTNTDVIFACRPRSIDCGGNAGDTAYTAAGTSVRNCGRVEFACF